MKKKQTISPAQRGLSAKDKAEARRAAQTRRMVEQTNKQMERTFKEGGFIPAAGLGRVVGGKLARMGAKKAKPLYRAPRGAKARVAERAETLDSMYRAIAEQTERTIKNMGTVKEHAVDLARKRAYQAKEHITTIASGNSPDSHFAATARGYREALKEQMRYAQEAKGIVKGWANRVENLIDMTMNAQDIQNAERAAIAKKAAARKRLASTGKKVAKYVAAAAAGAGAAAAKMKGKKKKEK